MPRRKNNVSPSVIDVLWQRMKDTGLVLYYRQRADREVFELINQNDGEHVEYVHPDTYALLRGRLMYLGQYNTAGGDTITVFKPGKRL